MYMPADPPAPCRSGPANAWKALLLYVLWFAVLLFQGFLYTSSLSPVILSGLNMFSPLLGSLLVLLFLRLSKERLSTVGITSRHWKKSLLLGGLLALLFVGGIALYSIVFARKSVTLHPPTLFNIAIFAFGAINEELQFRGYIETRLGAAIPSTVLCSCSTAALFWLAHYPVYWAPLGGVSFAALTAFHIVCLLILHALCDFVFRRTQCLWGAVGLHFLYNMGVSVFIFV